jgi:sugar-specific transcriptional regulator TrmB
MAWLALNWFLRLIGMQVVIDELHARTDRQIESLRDEIDILNEKIEHNQAEFVINVSGLREQVAGLLEHATRPALQENVDPGFQHAIRTLLAALDEDLRVLMSRLKTLESDTITINVAGDRVIQEIDDNSVRIDMITGRVDKLYARQ